MGGDMRLSALLLDSGATLNEVTVHGWTALHVACLTWDSELVEALLQANADLRYTDAQLNTPLHLATMHGNVQAAKVCLQHGANKGARNGSAQRPAEMAIFVQDPAVRSALGQLLRSSGENCSRRRTRFFPPCR